MENCPACNMPGVPTRFRLAAGLVGENFIRCGKCGAKVGAVIKPLGFALAAAPFAAAVILVAQLRSPTLAIPLVPPTLALAGFAKLKLTMLVAV